MFTSSSRTELQCPLRIIRYAKHAISVDENRADFKRVSWKPAKLNQHDSERNLYFEQVWVPGVHADIGGGYLENESRLSDISLRWMLAAASIVPNGIQHDPSVLKLWPDASGPQHDEQAGSFFKLKIRELPTDKETGTSEAIMHKSVYERLVVGPVTIFNRLQAYRPANLACHVDFAQYFDSTRDPQPTINRKCIADDIESKVHALELARRPLFP